MSANATGDPVTQSAADPWAVRARDWAEIEDENSRRLFERVFEEAGLAAGDRLLDVGCGSGLACALAAARGTDVAGLDASPGLLEIARERTPQGEFRAADMASMPFADDSFDLVTFFNSYFFASDGDAVLAEARRVARPGAAVAVVTWTSPDQVALSGYVGALAPLMPEPPEIDPFIDPEQLASSAERAGLTPERSLELDWSWEYPDLDTALRGLMAPGLSALAIEAAGEDAVRAALTEALRPLRTEVGTYAVSNTVRCLFARA